MTDASGEMTVVCLDCGRHLPYDWKSMRVLKTADKRNNSGAPPPGKPDTGTTKKKAALIGSAISLGVLLGQRTLRKRTAKAPEKPPE